MNTPVNTPVVVTKQQIDEAVSLINLAIENHATAVDVTGLGVLYYVLESLGIRLIDDKGFPNV